MSWFPVTVLSADRFSGVRLVIVRYEKGFALCTPVGAFCVATCKSARSLADWALDAGAAVETLPKPNFDFRVDDW